MYHEDGISMMVEQPTPGVGGRHREIHKTLRTLDPSLAPRDALAKSVARVKSVYQSDGVYTSEIRGALEKVIEQNKAARPDLFTKKG